MRDYSIIDNSYDIGIFIQKTNALHDGCIIAIEYLNNGIKISNNCYEFNPELKQLKIRVLITSIQDVILEMIFENILKWKITEDDNEILEADVCFSEEGFIIWSNDAIDLNNVEKNDSYVIAKKMKWSFL